jgi:hypothetical protein
MGREHSEYGLSLVASRGTSHLHGMCDHVLGNAVKENCHPPFSPSPDPVSLLLPSLPLQHLQQEAVSHPGVRSPQGVGGGGRAPPPPPPRASAAPSDSL